ncbi:hypothetical protein MesoLj131b_69300 (plasmid) [Mesorhizobium sp. 131-2-5]|nr:hypothetical protein MesoLj131b_69300 [Mesorhizobium sp. 131-2-5]
MVESARRRRGGAQGGDGRPNDHLFDRELDHLPPEARWREWMNRVEATIFAASQPVTRETLARIVGKSCSIDLLIVSGTRWPLPLPPGYLPALKRVGIQN